MNCDGDPVMVRVELRDAEDVKVDDTDSVRLSLVDCIAVENCV